MTNEKLPNELDSIEQIEELLADLPSVLLYFYSDNCAPCLSLRPKVVELVCDRFPNVRIGFINGEIDPLITATFSVFAFPTLILYFEGKEHYRGSKYLAIPQLAETINKPYTLLFET